MKQVNFLDIDDIDIQDETGIDVMDKVVADFELSDGSVISLDYLEDYDWYNDYVVKLIMLPDYDENLETWLRISW